MAARTDELLTKPKMTTARWIAIFVIIAALLGLGYCAAMALLQPGDEPPIRVRNGSMNIELDKSRWVDVGNGWSPSAGRPSGTHAVEVRTASAHTCPDQDPKATWQVVSITYSDNFEVLLTPSAGARSVVTPKRELTHPGHEPRLLQYGRPGVGYIRQIDLRGGGKPWSCTFTAANQLSVINICPAASPGC